MILKGISHRFAVAMISVMVAFSAIAQSVSTITHVMQRGETLQTIAARYSTTPQAIIELNPEAAEFTYVGMEIKVPVMGGVNTKNSTPLNPIPAESTGSNTYVPETNMYSVHHSDPIIYNAYDSSFSTAPWSGWGINYIANFSNNGKGFYGLYAEILNEAGFGAYMSAGVSYGIVKKGQVLFRVGPDYGRALSENIMFSCPLAFNIATFDHVREIKESIKGKIITNEDMKTSFGISFTPKIGIKIEKVNLTIGLDVNYFFQRKLSTEDKINHIKYDQKYGGKAYVGFTIGLGTIKI